MVSFSRYISSPSFRFVSHISVSTFELFYPLFPQRKLRKRRIFLNSSFSASTFFVHASIVPHFSVDCSLRFFIRNSLPPLLGSFSLFPFALLLPALPSICISCCRWNKPASSPFLSLFPTPTVLSRLMSPSCILYFPFYLQWLMNVLRFSDTLFPRLKELL